MSYPCTVNDIQPYLLYEYKDKENKYAIGSISRDRFIEVNESSTPVVMKAIKLMDGSKSFDEIDKTVFETTGFLIKSKDLYEILSRADLLLEADNNKAEKSEFETLALKIFDFKIEKYKKFFSYLSFLAVPTLFIFVLLVIFTSIFVYSNGNYLSSFSLLGFQDHYVRNFLIMFVVMALSVSFHEIAHGITASKYNITPKSFSISLYLYVSPIVYIRLPGLYAVKPLQRIHIWISGVVVNSLFACCGLIASILLAKHDASQFYISICNYTWYINLIFVIVNLCPLMPLDGYFILATIMKIPNMRKHSFAKLGKSLRNRKIKFTISQLIYFILSLAVMSFVVIKEVYAMIHIFVINFSEGMISALWSIKQYIALIIFIVVVRIIRAKANKKLNNRSLR